MKRSPLIFLSMFSLLTLLQAAPEKVPVKPQPVKEGFSSISVQSTAPIPKEVSNATQAQALAKDAAVTMGQTRILTYVLEKKTHSGKKLSEAEYPSLQTQKTVRGLVQGAKVEKVTFTKEDCTVVLRMSKTQLKKLLRAN